MGFLIAIDRLHNKPMTLEAFLQTLYTVENNQLISLAIEIK
jgi:hypothetical protein